MELRQEASELGTPFRDVYSTEFSITTPKDVYNWDTQHTLRQIKREILQRLYDDIMGMPSTSMRNQKLIGRDILPIFIIVNKDTIEIRDIDKKVTQKQKEDKNKEQLKLLL